MIIIQLIGYILFSALVLLCRMIPHIWANKIVGGLFYGIGRHTKKHTIILRNLQMVYPDWDTDKRAQMARGAWYNLGYVFVDMMRGHKIQMDSQVTFENAHHLTDALKNKGALAVTAHLGSWEMILPIVTHLHQKPYAIYRFVKNPFMDRWVRTVRGRYSKGLLEKNSNTTALDMMRAVKNGDTVVILPDQKMNTGITVDFLGRPSKTAIGVGSFVNKNIPAIPIQIIRNPDTISFRVVIHPPLENPNTGDKTQDIEAITQQMCHLFDTWIHQNPEQYLWHHRRWDKDKYR